MNNLAITSLLLGLLTTTSPCILPLYPGFLAYLSGQNEMGRQKYFLGLFVLAGVLTMMLILGGLIALLAIPVGSVLVYVLPLANLLIFLLGILLLLNQNPFKTLPTGTASKAISPPNKSIIVNTPESTNKPRKYFFLPISS